MSTGASVAFTICSKCGNVAKDETQLCHHIKYEKGNNFYDANGVRRKVAELCGHHSVPGSVRFIEASWVGNPAFTGAVVTSILNPGEAAAVADKAAMVLAEPAPEPDSTSMLRAAKQGRFGL